MASFAFESSGKLKAPSAEKLAEVDLDTAILAYTCGRMADGRPYYAYIAVKPSLYPEFHALTAARKTFVLGEYGTVIASGFAEDAPPDVVQYMRDTYGFDEHYEEKLEKEVLKQQAEFIKKQQDKRIEDAVALLKRKSEDGGEAA